MSSCSYYLFHFCFLFITSACLAQTNFHPKTFFLAVKQDPSTLQYITEIHQRTPLIPVKLAVHVGSENLWVDCETGFKSSTYKPAHCDSRQCNLARSTSCGDCKTENNKTRPGCNNNACYNTVSNPAMNSTFYSGGEIAEDVLTIQSINGSYTGFESRGPVVTVPKFIFSCSPSFLTQNLGKDVKGMIGFGQQSPVSFATQLASTFRFSRQFAICLSSSPLENGIIFIGHRPYYFALGFDASQDLFYTPIITQPRSEYYIQVSSIRINGKTLSLNKTLLSLDENEEGGTRISTAVPYTELEPSIYSALSKAFISEMPKEVKTVSPVPPFKTCFNSSYIGITSLGYNAPGIYFVLHNPNVYWTITGANSLLLVRQGVFCLAFVERKKATGQAIVIGGYQMQNNLVEFDLARRRIGFTNSLFFRQTMCSDQFYT
ncbi:probable aspartic proteinase GIP2 [Solanum dulcamara]|uniref:probable aspartic proteinase GIP2 n=1 Tax=Solanum dulcamara TaxID=45834 RepID=UPI0024866999|nr:probable aspartic proteinase GIP2 [Solanum dulcamara]